MNIETMDYQKLLKEVTTILGRFSKQDRTIDETSLLVNDLGLDSLQVMEVVHDLEDTFDISFPLNNLSDVRTVKDLVQEIHQLIEAG